MSLAIEMLGDLFRWVLRSSAQAGVLVVAILAILALARQRLTPKWRHALWLLLLLRLAIPWSPSSPFSLYRLTPFLRERSASVHPEASAAADGAPSGLSQQRGAPTLVAPAPAAAKAEKKDVWNVYTLAAPIGWLAGACFLMVTAFGQSAVLAREFRRRRPVTDQRVLDLLEDCKEAMDVRVGLTVIETPRVSGPALFGVIRPRLLLPEGSIDSLGAERLRHVFLHELAHLKRHDVALNWAMTVLQALHWFNPLVWFGFRWMRAERELACDAMALSCVRPGESSEYGRTIVHLLEGFSQSRRLPSLAGILEDKTQIRRRIAMIAMFGGTRRRGAALGMVVIAVLAVAALSESRDQSSGQGAVAASTSKEMAVQFVGQLARGEFDAAARSFDEAVKKAMSVEMLRQTWGKVQNEAGSFKGIAGLRTERAAAFDMVYVRCDFEKGPMDVKVVYGDQKLVTGLWFVPTQTTMPYENLPGRIAAQRARQTPDPVVTPATTIVGASGRYEDKIDLPFVDDPAVIGSWESVDFVQTPDQFKPGQTQWKGDLFLKEMGFLPGGRLAQPWWTWTKGLVLHSGDKTASAYTIKEMNGTTYMFYEWKSGDYSIRHMKPQYYVLKKSSGATPEVKRIVDDIDLPFVDDPAVVGAWKSVDFVDTPEQFKADEPRWKGDLFLKGLAFLPGGKTSMAWTWTKGLLLHPGDKTASKYIIKEANGATYLLFEWKSGDYAFGHMKPKYYVLKKMPEGSPEAAAFELPKDRIVDKIDYPFVDNPSVIGTWKSVDFVDTPEQFKAGQVPQWGGELFLKELVFLPGGKTLQPWLTWTKGLVFHSGDKTASAYTIKEMDGAKYMFFEWKSGDYTIRHMKPKYYVLKKD